MVTEWKIGDSNVNNMSYTGLNVSQISFSQAVVVLALRSGTSK